MRVAVAGGTGTAGRQVVRALQERGHEAVVLSRGTGVNVATGSGLAAALDGVEAIVDASNTSDLRRGASSMFFSRVAQNLQTWGSRAGATRLIVLSIVGIDRVPLGYYVAKRRHEEAAARGPLSCTVLRATQFHEFPLQLMARLRLGPLRIVPNMTVQPVAAGAVGATAAELVLASQPPSLVEVAGPQVETIPSMARRLVQHCGRPGPVMSLAVPGAAGRAMRGGGLLPNEGARLRGPTFDDWLDGDGWRYDPGSGPT